MLTHEFEIISINEMIWAWPQSLALGDNIWLADIRIPPLISFKFN